MLHYLLRKAGSLIALAMVAVGALASSQLSAYMQHYQQNVAGRLAEGAVGRGSHRGAGPARPVCRSMPIWRSSSGHPIRSSCAKESG